MLMRPTSVESGLLLVNQMLVLVVDVGIAGNFEQAAADRTEAFAAEQTYQTLVLRCTQLVLKT